MKEIRDLDDITKYDMELVNNFIILKYQLIDQVSKLINFTTQVTCSINELMELDRNKDTYKK